MFEIDVGPVPVDLGAAVGLATGNSTARWRVQNRGNVSIYRTTAGPTDPAPDPATVHGYRHLPGDATDVRLTTLDVGRTWCWTSSRPSVLVVEPA